MKSSKKYLIFSIISLVLVSSVLALATFERTQSGFSVFGKNFFSGTRDGNYAVKLSWTDDRNAAEWNDVETSDNTVPLDDNIIWEPEHSEVRYFKITNDSSVDFTYNLGIDPPDDENDITAYLAQHPLGDVIDVQLCRDISNISARESIGTLSECYQIPNLLNKTAGDDLSLAAGESICYALVFTMNNETAGNDYQGAALESEGKSKDIGFRIFSEAHGDEAPEPEFDGNFGIKFLNNTEDPAFLYRVGNGNEIPAYVFFDIKESAAPSVNSLFAITAYAADFDPDKVGFTFTPDSATANTGFSYTTSGSYTTAEEFLDCTKFQFTGAGAGKLAITYNGQEKKSINLEVVDGNNVFDSLTTSVNFNSSKSNILFKDVISASSTVISKTLYGNGFCFNDTRNNPSGTSGFVTINNGDVYNVRFIGYEPESAVATGITNPGYAPAVRAGSGYANLYHCYFSGGRYALFTENTGSEVYAEDTVFDGGAFGNIYIGGGDVTLKDCVTSTSTRGGLKGLGIHVTSKTDISLTLLGTFRQHNWLLQSDLPSAYSSVFSGIYSDSEYYYTYNNKKYVNMGILFMATADGVNITTADAQSIIDDRTGNSYGYITKTSVNKTGTGYLPKSSQGSAEMIGDPTFVPDNYYTVPNTAFDFTNKNYIAQQSGSNNYCYYDSATKRVNLSFDKTNPSTVRNWDTDILTVTKYGSSLSYTVTMNGVDYTGRSIPFSETGIYNVIYTYTDPYNFDKDLNQSSRTYTKTVTINVNAVEPDVIVYDPAFSYTGTWANSAKTEIISNNIYVMPDVSAASDTIGSTTVGGRPVYFPVVTVDPTSNNGSNPYENGKGSYYAPVFNALNITDYNQDTGTSQYTYNTSSTTWPHGKSTTAGPDSAVFGYDANAEFSNQPYGRSMQTQYYGYGKNGNGLCYTAFDIEKVTEASNHLVRYHYVANNGKTYYFYIKYSFTKLNYEAGSTCFAEGTPVTMAGGRQKVIEDITFNDRILSYNFFTGDKEAKNIALLVNHGKDYYKVLNLEFKDGTVLRIIGDHGVFDYTLNKYVYLTGDNYKDYIGHRFVKLNENGRLKKVKLTGAFVTDEYITAYSITSAQNSNAFAQGMLTVAPPDVFYNWIDMGRKMRYDKKQFDADVEKYGLYDYSVFKDYVSYDSFIAFNGPYLKVAVEKGNFTFDDIINLIRLYKSYMQ